MLLHRGQLRICALGDGAVGESADRHFVGHFPSGQFARVEDARSCFVIDGEEAVRMIRPSSRAGVMAIAFSRLSHNFIMLLVHRNPILFHRVHITVPPVFRYFEVGERRYKRRCACSPSVSYTHGGKRTGIIVYHHPFGVDTGTDAIVENDRNIVVQQFLVMVISGCVFGERSDDSANPCGEEGVNDFYLSLVLLVALRHQDVVARFRRRSLNAAQHTRKEVVN